MHRHYAQTDTVLSICYCSHIATSQIKDIPQICFFCCFFFFAVSHMEGKWKFCILRNAFLKNAWKFLFLARFCLKNEKNIKNEQFLSHFGK